MSRPDNRASEGVATKTTDEDEKPAKTSENLRPERNTSGNSMHDLGAIVLIIGEVRRAVGKGHPKHSRGFQMTFASDAPHE